jgi:hypothetical protein
MRDRYDKDLELAIGRALEDMKRTIQSLSEENTSINEQLTASKKEGRFLLSLIEDVWNVPIDSFDL